MEDDESELVDYSVDDFPENVLEKDGNMGLSFGSQTNKRGPEDDAKPEVVKRQATSTQQALAPQKKGWASFSPPSVAASNAASLATDHAVRPNLESRGEKLIIMKVPRKSNNISMLATHFGKFGEVLNIVVRPDDEKAVIQFATRDMATAALGAAEPYAPGVQITDYVEETPSPREPVARSSGDYAAPRVKPFHQRVAHQTWKREGPSVDPKLLKTVQRTKGQLDLATKRHELAKAKVQDIHKKIKALRRTLDDDSKPTSSLKLGEISGDIATMMVELTQGNEEVKGTLEKVNAATKVYQEAVREHAKAVKEVLGSGSSTMTRQGSRDSESHASLYDDIV